MNTDNSIKILDQLKSINSKLDGMDNRLGTLEEDLAITKKSTLTMEVEHNKKLDVLLEQYSFFFGHYISHNVRLSNLETTSELHSYEIALLKASK